MNEERIDDIDGGRVPDPGGARTTGADTTETQRADRPDWVDRFHRDPEAGIEADGAAWRRRWARSVPSAPTHPRIWN